MCQRRAFGFPILSTTWCRWRPWRGDLATLGRAPAGFRDGARVGAGGPLGSWLAQTLAAVDGRAVPAGDPAALTAQVFAFQLAQGLTPDGLAGPLALMKLNRASGVDEPRLVAARQPPPQGSAFADARQHGPDDFGRDAEV